MKFIAMPAVVLAAVVSIGSALAVPPKQKVEYAGGGLGQVVFDGKIHAAKGLQCDSCHTKIFEMKKGSKITMAEINAGKSCGTCHNGGKAFKASDGANCGKCHKK